MRALSPLCASLVIHGLLLALMMPIVGNLFALPQEKALGGMRLDFDLMATTGHLTAVRGMEEAAHTAPAEKKLLRPQPVSMVKSDVPVLAEPKPGPRVLPQPDFLPEPVVQKKVKLNAPAPAPHSRPEPKVQTEPLVEQVILREDIMTEQLEPQEFLASAGKAAIQLEGMGELFPVEEKATLESSLVSRPVSAQTPIATANLTQSNSLTEATLADSGIPSATEMALEGYRKANYAAIHQSIYDQLHYPRLAQRRGWKGRILVLFRVTTDGTLLDAEVVHSSGYPLLDKQALKAVSDAAPFTPPAVTAQFLMPVIFKLR